MSRLVPPALAAAVLTAVCACLGARADACNPGPEPKPGPSAPLASIDLVSETVTGDTANVSLSPIDFGSGISLTIPNKTAPRSYGLSIPLSSEETLAVLSGGGAAITRTYPIPPSDYSGSEPPADYQDGLGDDNPDEEADPNEPAAPDDGTENIDDDQDPSWYQYGDAIDTGARDGSDIESDAFDQASTELPDGNWVMISAFDPPVATDANGGSVPVSLVKTSDGVTVSIFPSSSAAFPIEVKLAYGYNVDSYDPPTSSSPDTGSSLHTRSAMARSAAASSLSAQASTSCSGNGAEVVVSDSSGWSFLVDAFRQWPTACADYFISVAPEKSTDLPRKGSPAKFRALNKKVTKKKDRKNYPHWNDSGAKLTPLAEINFINIGKSAVFRGHAYDWVGQHFGRYMRQRGYKMWSIDEFAKFTTDPEHNVTLWNEYNPLINNLYLHGNKKGNSKGIIFSAEARQDPKKSNTIRDSKAKWKMLFSEPEHFDWAHLANKTKLWADEDYTKCSVVCVPGTKLSQKAQHTNAYMQKIGRLAFANDAPSSVASTRSFLSTRFVNLINGWGAVYGKTVIITDENGKRKKKKTNGYGTYDMSVGQIRKLVGLQVYAARSWMNSNSSYSGGRIGVRWVNRLDPIKQPKHYEHPPKHLWNAAMRARLAQRIARAIAGAYSPGGSPVKACDSRTGHSSTGLCQPAPTNSSATDFTQAKRWNTFRKWGGGNSGCTAPSNDDFANAKTITGYQGSADIPLECATWEPGEIFPNGPSTKSVWYRWDAPTSGEGEFVTASAGSGAFLETNAYTGNSLGNLKLASVGCGIPTDGETYWIQVVDRLSWGGDAPAGPFTLSWYPGYCVQ